METEIKDFLDSPEFGTLLHRFAVEYKDDEDGDPDKAKEPLKTFIRENSRKADFEFEGEANSNGIISAEYFFISDRLLRGKTLTPGKKYRITITEVKE